MRRTDFRGKIRAFENAESRGKRLGSRDIGNEQFRELLKKSITRVEKNAIMKGEEDYKYFGLQSF